MPITIMSGPDDYPPIISIRATGPVTGQELADFVREKAPASRLHIVLDGATVTETEATAMVRPLVVSLETETRRGSSGPMPTAL